LIALPNQNGEANMELIGKAAIHPLLFSSGKVCGCEEKECRILQYDKLPSKIMCK
jgi:hypothetical protein